MCGPAPSLPAIAVARSWSTVPLISPVVAEGAAEHVGDVGLEAAHRERRRDRTQQRAELAAGDSGNGARAAQLRVARTIGERTIPVQRLAERRRQSVARERILDPDFRS